MEKKPSNSRMPRYKKQGMKGPDKNKDEQKRTVRRGGGHSNNDGGGGDDNSIDSHGNIRGLIAYSADDESEPSDFESEPESVSKPLSRPPQRKAAKKALETIRNNYLAEEESPKINKLIVPRKRIQKDDEDDEDDEDDDEEDDEDDDDDDDDEDDDDEDMYEYIDEENEDYEDEQKEHTTTSKKKKTQSKTAAPTGISISFGSFGPDDGMIERMVPKRHNMKKEPDTVKKFVKLITAPPEETTIDDQIDQFKALPDSQQRSMIESLERRPKADGNQNTMFRILSMKINPAIQSLILTKYNALQALDPTSSEYYKNRNWVEKATALPLGDYKDMPVKLDDGQEKCGGFMERARVYLDAAIYGQSEAKLQILQFIAAKITNPDSRGLSLLLAGPPGVGKTSLIKNGIAKALDWPFQFISLGGDSDASTYTGHQLVYEGSHAGKIVNSIIAAKSLSMVLMFDEVDKISATPKGEEVQHLLIHLTDPVQNGDFEDKYLSGIPIDLSKIMFVFSANDIGKLDRVLLDRFVVIELEGYKPQEKVTIAEKFLWPEALAEVNLVEKVAITKEIIEHIIETYCKGEPGVRELRRCCIQIAQKINMLRMFNTKDLPFHIPDFQLPFVLKKDHIKLFLTKREDKDKPPQGMYV
jgi:ATP-dependent Lon protease